MSKQQISAAEKAAMDQGAIKVRERIMAEAAQHGISREDMARAIGRHA